MGWGFYSFFDIKIRKEDEKLLGFLVFLFCNLCFFRGCFFFGVGLIFLIEMEMWGFFFGGRGYFFFEERFSELWGFLGRGLELVGFYIWGRWFCSVC